MKLGRIGLILALACAPMVATAQAPAFVSLDSSARITALDTPISARFDRVELRHVVAEIAHLASLRLTYDPGLAGLGLPITMTFAGTPARQALQRILEGSSIGARASLSGQLVLVAAPHARQERLATLHGVVRAPDSSSLGGVRIDLVGTRFSTYSRDNGSFTLGRVPAGSYTVRAMRVGFSPATRAISVDTVSETVDLVLTPAPIPLAAVVVTPAYYGLLTSTVASAAVLDRQQLETIPQIGEDIHRAMTRLPGVASDDFSADFAVRGAGGQELYVTLDGLQLIEPFHLRDLKNSLSIIDIRTLDHVELTSGGAPVEYGDHTGGVLRMSTVAPRTDRVHAGAGVSVMNARVVAEGGFARGKGGWLASVRRGYMDLAFRLLAVEDSINPWYYDAFAKAQYDAGRYGQFSIHGLMSQDRLTFAQNGSVLASRYPSHYVWGRWQSAMGSRLDQETVVSYANLDWGRDASSVRGDSSLRIVDQRALRRVAARQDWRVAVSERALARFGFELADERASYDYRGTYRRFVRLTDSTGYRYDTTIVAASPTDTRTSTYAALRLRPLQPLTLETGARLDGSTNVGNSVLSPRINAAWQLASATTVRAAWGRHTQFQPLYTLQVQSGEREFSAPERAEQRELGLDLGLPGALSLRAQVYERLTSNERERWVNTGAKLDVIPEVATDRELVDASSGRARGMELTLARLRADHMEWGLGYTLSKVTDDVAGVQVPRDVDQRHAVQLDWAFHPTSNAWRLSVSGMWHSGRPYTPITLFVDTVSLTPNGVGVRTVNEAGALNSARTPGYRRFDARWTRYFDTRYGRVMLFADVFNLLNTKNSRGLVPSLSIFGRRVTVGSEAEEMIGRLPTIGVTWEF